MILHHRALFPLRALAEATDRAHELRRDLHEQSIARRSFREQRDHVLQRDEDFLERLEREPRRGLHELQDCFQGDHEE